MIKTVANWYEPHSDSVVEGADVPILWGFSINTNNTTKSPRYYDQRQKKVCTLIDMSVPSDKNISVKVIEKLSKYKDPEMEIEKKCGT